jgi:hypothetical protein
MSRMNKIIHDIGFAKLVAEIYEGEITICLESETISQDIVMVRKNMEHDKTVDCLVWRDEYSEDYTNAFQIKLYEEEKGV